MTTKPGLALLLRHLRREAWWIVLAVSLSLTGAAVMLGQPLLIRSVLERLDAAQPVGGRIILLVATAICGSAVNSMRDYVLQRTAEGFVYTVRLRLAGHLLRLPLTEYHRHRTGDLLSRFGADTTLVQTVITSGVLELAAGGIVVVAAATMMTLIDPVLFAITVGGMACLSLTMFVSRRLRGVSEHAQACLGTLTSSVQRALSAVRTIRASRAETRETASIAGDARRAYLAGLQRARLYALIGPAAALAGEGTFLLVIGVGGVRVHTGAMSIGDLVAFVLLLFVLAPPMSQAVSLYAQLQAASGALRRIDEILRLPAETARDVPIAAVEPLRGAPAIEFDRVSFGFEPGAPVLHAVSFAVPYGSRTALVGPSGAGKSTLLALVERFYDVSTGSVRVGGVDVRDLSRDVLRAQLGYVEQDAPVPAGTIRDNLLLNAPEAGEHELAEALDAVNLACVAHRAPGGLDAQVGEGGGLLSGGERQRLAVARALLGGPPILLLDEPTSNLDAVNENLLRDAIVARPDDRTVLVVAHRISTIADCDQIIVLDQGRVAAIGRHDELLHNCPLYRGLAELQLLKAN